MKSRTLNRVQIAIALTSSLIALTLCVASLTVAPHLGVTAGLCGLGAAANWLMCD